MFNNRSEQCFETTPMILNVEIHQQEKTVVYDGVYDDELKIVLRPNQDIGDGTIYMGILEYNDKIFFIFQGSFLDKRGERKHGLIIVLEEYISDFLRNRIG